MKSAAVRERFLTLEPVTAFVLELPGADRALREDEPPRGVTERRRAEHGDDERRQGDGRVDFRPEHGVHSSCVDCRFDTDAQQSRAELRRPPLRCAENRLERGRFGALELRLGLTRAVSRSRGEIARATQPAITERKPPIAQIHRAPRRFVSGPARAIAGPSTA